MDVAAVPGVPEWVAEHLAEEGIESLYPPQAAAVEAGVTEGRSLVASVPTASGKTLVAQLAMLSAITDERGERDRPTKALYIVPLRALASEKRAEFEGFEAYGVDVGVSTGNYESDGGWLASKDVIVATSEKVDSLVRNDAEWLSELTCVVADEVHLVDDGERGPTLEVTLAKLRRINPDLQTVALSATIGNADELAEWLDAELVDSDWRPIELQKGIHYGQALNLEDGTQRELPVEGGEKQEAAIVRDTLEDGGSTLVFVNSRRNAEAAAKRLGTTTRPALSPEERERLATIADEIRQVSDTETSEDLATAVEAGSAFHHAGLCVTGDTQILKEDGTFDDIKSIVSTGGGTVIGLSGHSLQETPITDAFEMDERPVLEIETRTGNTLRLSETHPLPVLRPEGIVWKPAGEITDGEFVARPRCLDIDVEMPEFRSLVPDEYRPYREYDTVKRLAKGISGAGLPDDFRGCHTRNRNISLAGFRQLCGLNDEDPTGLFDRAISDGGQRPVKVPRDLNEDIGWLVGTVTGDGFVHQHGVTLTGRSTLLEEFSEICRNQFGREPSRDKSQSGTPLATINSKLIADILHTHFGLSSGGKKQPRLPTVPLDDELLGAYLSGLFDTDGSVQDRPNKDGSPAIEFYSNDETFVKQVKTALLRFGIIAFKDTREVNGRVTECGGREIQTLSNVHRLTIYGIEEFRRFRENIGFRHPEKASKLSSILSNNTDLRRGQNDIIPSEIGERVREVRNEKGLSLADLEPEVPKASLSRFENGVTPMKRTTFAALAAQLLNEQLLDIAFSDIFWDRIDSIEETGTEELYDLSTGTSNFVANGVIAHNTSDHRSLVEDAFRDRLVKAVSATPTLAAGVNTPARRVVVRDWRRFDGDAGGMQPLSVLEVHQMMGRAGRPGLDPYGEAVLLANSHDELDELFERYVWADPEPVRSKLAAEPALRTHILATVASGFARSRSGLLEFLERTLYASQTDEGGRLEGVVEQVIEYLVVNDFLDREYTDDGGQELSATSLGHTVSRLYLDPMSAAEIVDGLRHWERNAGEAAEEGPSVSETSTGEAEVTADGVAPDEDDEELTAEFTTAADLAAGDGDEVTSVEEGATTGDEATEPATATAPNAEGEPIPEPSALGLYHLVARTPDMYRLYLRSGDEETYTELAYEREPEFLGPMPREADHAFDDWLSALKTAAMLEEWAGEVDEDEIAQRYGVGPGDIRGKVETAQWLLGAAESLSSELGLASTAAIRKARIRVEHGVGEELIDLAGVRGVGRKRARRLYDAGVETRAELREADKSVVLGAVRGRENTAERILENAGHRDPSMEGVEATQTPAAGDDSTAGDGDSSADEATPPTDGAEDESQSSLGDF